MKIKNENEVITIEQKAQRYDEALEIAKTLYGSSEPMSGCNVIIETLFPELKESEDEKIRKGIIDFLWKEKIFLQEAHSSVENNPKYRFVMDAIAWLEKQGDKPAWSEEDEVKINRIVACLENLNVADNDILLKDVDWLKSLKPQNRWKPSDEQMMALLYHCSNGSVLTSLYNDLNKLKG